MVDQDVLPKLTRVRAADEADLKAALDHDWIIGVTGDAQVGKSTLLRAILRERERELQIHLDLTGPTSSYELVRTWALELAKHVVDTETYGQVSFGDPDHWPLSTHRALAAFTEDAGPEVSAYLGRGFEMDKGELSTAVAELMRATERLAGARPALVVVDHLEAPGLTFRHLIDAQALLWQIRSVLQAGDTVRAVVCCRPPAIPLAVGDTAAFYGEGEWFRMQLPSPEHFAEATGQPERVVHDALRFTRGHVASTMELLGRISDGQQMIKAIDEIARSHHDLANRTLEYARSLHRLGGRMLMATALRRGPYRTAPEENPNSVASAMRRLHSAGLVLQPEGGMWTLTDPRLEWVLAGAAMNENTLHVLPGGYVDRWT